MRAEAPSELLGRAKADRAVLLPSPSSERPVQVNELSFAARSLDVRRSIGPEGRA
jgi:hypothetical protein